MNTGIYKSVRYAEIGGEIHLTNCREAPVFWSIGAMQRWVDNNVEWCCPSDAGG